MGLSTRFNIISLCSGVGGLDLGLKLAVGNARTVCYVEIESYAQKVLASRIKDGGLDDAPIWSDLKTFDGKPWRGKVDCVIGGYPCQPWSIAGRKLGTEDPRHLFPYIANIVRDIQPEWCFFENVSNHLNLGFREVKSELESMDYEVEAGLFTAAEVGATHKRERLFILAHSRREYGKPRREISSIIQGQFEKRDSRHQFERPSQAQLGYTENTNDESFKRGQREIQLRGRCFDVFPPTPESTEWESIVRESPGLSPAIKPELRGVVDGMDAGLDVSPLAYSRDRLHAIGNGVVPLQSAFAFRVLVDKLSKRE